MSELIKYISDILNIKTESVYTIQDMTEELSQIKDIVSYRSYIKDNIKSVEVDYTNGYQKFIILTRNYLDLEFNATVGIEVKRKAKELAAKVDSCRNYIEDTAGAFSQVKKTDGTFLFEQWEIELMRSTGSAMWFIEASRNHTLEDELNRRIKIAEKPKAYEQLPQRLEAMTSKALGVLT